MSLRTSLFLVLLAALALAGCGVPVSSSTGPAGLQIMSMVGALGGTPEQAVYSYELTVRNTTGSSLQLEWAKPVPGSGILPRLAASELQSQVNKIVEPGSTVQVTGEVRFDTKGLSKEEITRLEPYVTGFQLASISFASVPGH